VPGITLLQRHLKATIYSTHTLWQTNRRDDLWWRIGTCWNVLRQHPVATSPDQLAWQRSEYIKYCYT